MSSVMRMEGDATPPHYSVRVENLLMHDCVSFEVAPLTILLGPPKSGRQTLLKAIYTVVWATQGRPIDSMFKILFPGTKKLKFKLQVADARIEYRDGKVIIEGTSPWRYAILLPMEFHMFIRAVYEMAMASVEFRASLKDAAILGGLAAVLARLIEAYGFLSGVGKLSLLSSDLLAQVGDREAALDVHKALLKALSGQTLKVFQEIIPAQSIEMSYANEYDIMNHTLKSLITHVKPSTLVMVTNMRPLIDIEDLLKTIIERNRRGDNIYLVSTMSLHPRLVKLFLDKPREMIRMLIDDILRISSIGNYENYVRIYLTMKQRPCRLRELVTNYVSG